MNILGQQLFGPKKSLGGPLETKTVTAKQGTKLIETIDSMYIVGLIDTEGLMRLETRVTIPKLRT